MRHTRLTRCFGVGILALGAFGACGPSSGKARIGEVTGAGGRGQAGADGGNGLPGGAGGTPIFDVDAAVPGEITLTPPSFDVTVDPGAGPPAPVPFTIQGNGTQSVLWRLTNPDLGVLDSSGVFTPSTQVGGEGFVVAVVGQTEVRAPISVTIRHRQNGSTGPAPGADAGSVGGLGGVGGEGEGSAVPDGIVAILEGQPAQDASLRWLYPYDQTVFPLGILPPLLQWSEGQNGAIEGVYVHLWADPHYDYKGFFARPPGLAAGANFVRHPIPRSVWESATKTAAGGTLNAEIVVAAGGQAYGPIRESWKIALAPFKGTIYYQAYATAFVQNEPDLAVWGGRFGGATLSIRVGDEAPSLVAGTTTDDQSGCRVCHSVSAYGDRMIAQHGNAYADTSIYDLKNNNTESAPFQSGSVGWAGLYPDGTLGLANSIDVTGSNSNDGDTALYDMTTGQVVPSPGLLEFATRIALPAFSPDGKKAAFTLFEGASTPAVGPANTRKLVAMDFDLATKQFSNPVLLWDAPADDQRPSFVTFMPTSTAAVFQRRWKGSNDDALSTWYGARGELWWVDLATQAASPLDRLNGVGYVPDLPNDHADDERLNYEPSISPVASGGYAWVVFMSRRAYGNVATSEPWASDPRNIDTRTTITTKKLWMAAIDLNAAPGEDPSHPAFYIPGQEIHGVNSRPFFALEPCVSDRGTCSSGIDCCTGFCRDGYCSPPPVNECSRLEERCEDASDCCDTRARCIGGFCALFVQ